MIFVDLCSHERSHQLFTEALKNANGFVSTLCESYENFKSRLCDFGSKLPLGGREVDYSKGNYFLVTNARSPYSKE